MGTNLTLASFFGGITRHLTLTGTTKVEAGQFLNLNGGSLSTGSLVGDGTVTFNRGTLTVTGAGGLVIGSGQPISNLNLGTSSEGRTLSVTNTTTISAGGSLILANAFGTPGTFETGSLALNGGTLTIQNTGRTIAAPITGDAASTINIQATDAVLGTPFSFNGFHYDGVLNVGANNVTLNSAGYARLGVLTSLAGGTINAPNGVTFASGSNFLGNGTVSARVTGELGSVISAAAAGGALALGDSASPAGFNFAGELRTYDVAVTLNSSAQAALGNLTTLGFLGSPGTLNAANGFVVDFGESVTGVGTINSINALAKRAIVNGTVQGNSAAQPITLTGYVKGVGTFGNVVFAGTFAPGLSPAVLTVGNLAFSPTNRLIMELGGTTPGSQHDQLIYSGTASFAGTLDIDLLGGFTPDSADEFVLATYSSRTGEFGTLDFPPLSGGLTWSLDYGPTNLTLSVTSTLLPGDIDLDGDVDRTDAALFTPHLGTTTGAIWTTGDFDGDGMTTLHDLALQQANFGATLPSPAASANAVPEPASSLLLACAAAIFTWARAKRK